MTLPPRLSSGIAAALIAWIGGPFPAAPAPRRVLFIGNSLTYVNDLPGTVAALLTTTGDRWEVASATAPNTALIDHLNGASSAMRLLASERWDFVILQQGPTTTRLCRDSLLQWTRTFAGHIRMAGAEPAMLMPWPDEASAERFPAVQRSFELAAGAVGGMLLPAGAAWRMALGRNRHAGLYGPDGYHPSATGTLLAALVIYERLTGRDARALHGVPGARPPSTGELTMLEDAAHEADTALPVHPAGSLPGVDSVFEGPPGSC